MNKRIIASVLAVLMFLLIATQTVTAAPSAKDLLKEGDNYLKQGDYGKAIESYESIITLYPKAKEANDARKKLEDRTLQAYQKKNAENREKVAGFIKDGDKYLADGKKDWEEEKQYNGDWKNWRRDSVDLLRRATNSYNEALKIDPNNAQAKQGLENVQKLTAEIQAADKQGFIDLQSAIAGVVLLNGEQTSYTVKGESSVRITERTDNIATIREVMELGVVRIVIDNANGEYTLAVKDDKGKVFPGDSVFIEKTGLRNTYSSMVLDPNPAPNSGDDFKIRQNAQGGITITRYNRGNRRQVVIPDTISGIKVTEIEAGAFSHVVGETRWDGSRGIYINIPPTTDLIYTVVIPNTVTTMGEQVFKDQTSLRSVVLSNNCAVIPNQAFYNCALETVTIPNSVTTIAGLAFAKNMLTSVNFGNRVAEIGESAFAANWFTELKNLPASLRTIYKRAFDNCNIETLVIPNGVTLLMANCFTNNPINNLTIPTSLAAFRKNPATVYYADEFYVGGFAAAFAGNKFSPGDFTMPANVADENLNQQFARDFIDFYKSQNKKAGHYVYDGRLWSVK